MRKDVKLGDIAKIYSGGTPSRTKPSYWGGNIPWIKTTQIQNCVITEKDVDEWITPEGMKKSSAKMVPRGTILMAMYGQGKTRGQVAVLGIDATINQACAAIIVKDSADSNYLYQQLLYRYSSIRNLSNTGSQENLSSALIKSIPFPLPDLLSQKIIAALLYTWDQAIEKTERLIAAKETQFSWLGLILINEQSKKHGWYKLKLGDICEPVTRKNEIGETNTLTSSAKRGLISQLDYYSKSVSGPDLSRYYLLKKGEFAYNRSSANGYPYGAIKRLDYCDQGVFSTLYLCFKISDKGKIYSDFLCNYFEAGCMNRALREICQAGARSHGLLNVTKGEFFNLKLFIPPIDQQKQIASILNTARQEIDLLKRQLEAYRKQKRGLMQKLLTGQWRVKIAKGA